MRARADARERAARAIGPSLIAIAFVAMLAFTWNRWPDPLVDFGRELYLPWQLSMGKVLYRDIAHFNGPLSQYFNAMIFRVFGASMRILVMTNIAIAIAMLVMIWKIFRAAGDRLSATVACMIFITLFMSLQYVSIGNYNWITPYSHELTHGVAFSLAGILALMRFRLRRNFGNALMIGGLLGLVFLTKLEVFLATAPVIVGGFVLAGELRRRFIGAFLIGFFAPAIVSTIALLFAMPIRDAIHGTLGAWPYAFDRRLSSMNFYKIGMGTTEPLANIRRALLQASMYLALLAPAFLLDRVARKISLVRRIAIAGTYLAVIAAVLFALDRRELIPWRDCLRGLTPVMIAASLFAIFRMDKRRPRGLLRAMLIALSTLLLAKIFLFARPYHYGFALALPAAMVMSAIGLSWISNRRDAVIAKAAMLAIIGLVIYKDVSSYARSFRIRPIVVAAGTSDAFRADDRGEIANAVLKGLNHLPPNATLAIVPQGVMLNYLSGHANPTPFITLMPPEVTMFGDDVIASAYARRPPDFIVVIPEQFGEYGFASFESFAPKTAAWVRANYVPSAVLRHPTLHIVLLRRQST